MNVFTSGGRAVAGAALLAALAAVPGLAGCGSRGGTASPAASPSAMTDAQVLAVGKELAQCIRDHGVPNFPDPGIENSRLTLSEGAEDMPGVDQALESCRSIMDRIPPSALGGKGDESRAPLTPEDLAKARRWARCVREHGLTEWPDPQADGTFSLRGTSMQYEGKSERMRQVFEACQEFSVRGIRITN